MYYKYQQGPLGSHFALNVKTVRIPKMLAIQPTSTKYHHQEAESVFSICTFCHGWEVYVNITWEQLHVKIQNDGHHQ